MYRCRYLAHGLYIGLYELRHCHLSIHAPEEREKNNYIQGYLGPKKSKVDWEKLFEKKKRLVEGMRNGEIPSFCKGCHWIEEFDENSENQFLTDFEPYIDIVWLGNFNECNARCMYCSAFEAISKKITTKDYGVIELLKEMFKKKIYDPQRILNSSISFSQGEPKLLKNFESILKLCEKYGNENVALYTNGIIHSRMVEKLLKYKSKVRIRIVISLDSGSREVFKKIKFVDKFDSVVKTIKRYAKSLNKENSSALGIKYIIVPYVNDNKEEIDKFFDLCVNKLGVKYLITDLEEKWFVRHNGEVPEYLKDLLRYFRDKCIDNGIQFEFFDRALVTKL